VSAIRLGDDKVVAEPSTFSLRHVVEEGVIIPSRKSEYLPFFLVQNRLVCIPEELPGYF